MPTAPAIDPRLLALLPERCSEKCPECREGYCSRWFAMRDELVERAQHEAVALLNDDEAMLGLLVDTTLDDETKLRAVHALQRQALLSDHWQAPALRQGLCEALAPEALRRLLAEHERARRAA